MYPSRSYSAAMYATLFLFAVFAVLWFCGCSRYSVLYYHEQIQLFRFDGLYFLSYLNQPGGLSGYLGSFLTQFYVYPVVGSVVLAGVLVAVVLLSRSVSRFYGDVGQLFFVPFIPAVLLLAAFTDIHFTMSAALGLLLVLAGFRLYISLSLSRRYVGGLVLTVVLYFVAGGNALLLSALSVIFELHQCRLHGKRTGRGLYLYGLLLLMTSALLPLVARHTIYTVSLREACFSQTPWNLLFPSPAHQALWLSLPALCLVGLLLTVKPKRLRLSVRKTMVLNCLLVVAMTVYGAYSVYDRRAEMLNRITYEVQSGNWPQVMQLGKDYPTKNRLICYYTNIALAESGQLPYRMFHYRQVGVAGLFLDWQLTYFSLWHLGEVYYRLGMIPEAEHCAFEALVASPQEPNAPTLRRLVTTNIERRDSAAAVKYLGYFDRSSAYRSWAKEQRAYLASAMADTAYHAPGIPTPRRYNDFFINYHYPDYTLQMLLQSDPKHRMAFEYLMAFYMLQKDVQRVKQCIDRFYGNFAYAAMPVHYEEALIVYQNLMQEGDEFYAQYPVGKATRERFGRYIRAFKAAQSSKRHREQLEKQFGDTYWYYVHFIEPSTLQKKDEKNRY